MQIEQITSAEALGPLLDAARAEGRCAIDTEFVWERTYAPGLCLVQIATAERLAVVDPVEGAPLEPVAELMADPAVEKVMHAPSGDLAAFVLHHDVRPQRVYDTQLAAGFAGYGGTLSLERLLEAVAPRPPAPRRGVHRLAAAAADADPVRVRGRRRPLPAGGRGRPRRSGSARRAGRPGSPRSSRPATARTRPSCRIPTPPGAGSPGAGRSRAEGLAALRAAAAWREREARRRDLPAAWLVKDATLVELARRRPATPKEAEGIRGLQIRRGRQLDELLATLADPGPPPEADAELPGDVRRRIRVVLPLASAVLQARCAAAGVASELVATRADLEAFIAGQALDSDRPHPLLTGLAPRACRRVAPAAPARRDLAARPARAAARRRVVTRPGVALFLGASAMFANMYSTQAILPDIERDARRVRLPRPASRSPSSSWRWRLGGWVAGPALGPARPGPGHGRRRGLICIPTALAGLAPNLPACSRSAPARGSSCRAS